MTKSPTNLNHRIETLDVLRGLTYSKFPKLIKAK